MPLSSSIVLCTFNGTRYLPILWESLLAQARLPDEIVVRDDASTDGTPALLATLREAAEVRGIRVRVLLNEKNVGYVSNFEAALRDASGEVLFLCDQDDVWHQDKVARQLEEFEKRSDLLFLCSDARRVDASGADLGRSLFAVLRVTRAELKKIHRGHGFEVLLRRNLATGATAALRNSLLQISLPFPARWIHDEWLAIVAAAFDGFDCLEPALVNYRQHDANQLGMPERNLGQKWKGLRNTCPSMLDNLLARGEVLLKRLRETRRVKAEYLALAAEKLDHLGIRRSLRGMPWRRLRGTLSETLNGRYRRYSSGWHSALRDLIPRG
jgi:glycosyltransferase involved in cell wall biosynthesis